MSDYKPRWMRLDNAAKIYPAARRRNWSNVFRLSATLNEKIDIEVLADALEVTVKRFPSIAVGLKRGFFWYYLEEISELPKIHPDGSWPNRSMTNKELKNCAFRVLVYDRRIACEFFHSLTDGNGGLVFLKTLTAEYISQKYGVNVPAQKGVLDRDERPTARETEDSFLKYSSEIAASRAEPNSFQLDGTPEKDGYRNVVTGVLDVKQTVALAKSYGVSLTAFLAAVMAVSAQEIQNRSQPVRRKLKPIKILIPVNLRNLFDSETLRNFVLYTTPGIDPRMGDYTISEAASSIYHQMKAEITPKLMSARIATNVKTEQNFALKIMPLFIKDFVMKLVYNIVGEKKSLLTVSNLGMVELPEEMKPYVERVDFVIGVQATCPNNCGVSSYGDKLYINFIRFIEEPDLEREFFTRLVRLGLKVKIESNQREDD